MKTNLLITLSILASTLSCSTTSNFEQYGSMHEVIGRQEHQARVSLKEFSRSKDYIGLGAIEKLQGEITIVDGNIIATTVSNSGTAIPFETKGEIKATMLFAQKVTSWRKIKIEKDMNGKKFEEWLTQQIKIANLHNKKKFMFKVEGEFLNIRTHVINGVCPVHARKNKVDIPDSKKPYEKTFKRKSGSLIGVYAPNSTGKITHPATNIHAHFVFKNEKNKYITGHIETNDFAKGSLLYLPKI